MAPGLRDVRLRREDGFWDFVVVVTVRGWGGDGTSLLPRPKPFTTFPFSFRGKGGSGPESGPVTEGRGPLGRMVGGRECGMGAWGGMRDAECSIRDAEVCRGWANGKRDGEIG